MKTKNIATAFAILAAALYAINVPLSKLLLDRVAPTTMAAFLYLGAGLGLLLYSIVGKAMGKTTIREPLTKKRAAVYPCHDRARYCRTDPADARDLPYQFRKRISAE